MKSSSEFSCDRVVSSPLCQIALFDFKVYLEARWHRPVTPALGKPRDRRLMNATSGCVTNFQASVSHVGRPCLKAKQTRKPNTNPSPPRALWCITALPSLCLIIWEGGNQQQMCHCFARRNWRRLLSKRQCEGSGVGRSTVPGTAHLKLGTVRMLRDALRECPASLGRV